MGDMSNIGILSRSRQGCARTKIFQGSIMLLKNNFMTVIKCNGVKIRNLNVKKMSVRGVKTIWGHSLNVNNLSTCLD